MKRLIDKVLNYKNENINDNDMFDERKNIAMYGDLMNRFFIFIIILQFMIPAIEIVPAIILYQSLGNIPTWLWCWIAWYVAMIQTTQQHFLLSFILALFGVLFFLNFFFTIQVGFLSNCEFA